MRSYTIIRLGINQKFYCYDSNGRFVARFDNLAEVHSFMDKVKRAYQFHRVVYSSTCLDDVVIVSFNKVL